MNKTRNVSMGRKSFCATLGGGLLTCLLVACTATGGTSANDERWTNERAAFLNDSGWCWEGDTSKVCVEPGALNPMVDRGDVREFLQNTSQKELEKKKEAGIALVPDEALSQTWQNMLRRVAAYSEKSPLSPDAMALDKLLASSPTPGEPLIEVRIAHSGVQSEVDEARLATWIRQMVEENHEKQLSMTPEIPEDERHRMRQQSLEELDSPRFSAMLTQYHTLLKLGEPFMVAQLVSKRFQQIYLDEIQKNPRKAFRDSSSVAAHVTPSGNLILPVNYEQKLSAEAIRGVLVHEAFHRMEPTVVPLFQMSAMQSFAQSFVAASKEIVTAMGGRWDDGLPPSMEDQLQRSLEAVSQRQLFGEILVDLMAMQFMVDQGWDLRPFVTAVGMGATDPGRAGILASIEQSVESGLDAGQLIQVVASELVYQFFVATVSSATTFGGNSKTSLEKFDQGRKGNFSGEAQKQAEDIRNALNRYLIGLNWNRYLEDLNKSGLVDLNKEDRKRLRAWLNVIARRFYPPAVH
ncbi:MAG: hypothetical protein HQL89_18555 [Magnetococcales bacterium]|nr:hypothetical protein [Magnetococcales bacterium]